MRHLIFVPFRLLRVGARGRTTGRASPGSAARRRKARHGATPAAGDDAACLLQREVEAELPTTTRTIAYHHPARHLSLSTKIVLLRTPTPHLCFPSLTRTRTRTRARRQEGFPQTAHVVQNRMAALGGEVRINRSTYQVKPFLLSSQTVPPFNFNVYRYTAA